MYMMSDGIYYYCLFLILLVIAYIITTERLLQFVKKNFTYHIHTGSTAQIADIPKHFRILLTVDGVDKQTFHRLN